MADFEINKQNTLSQSSRLTEVGGTVKSVKSMVSNANSGLVGIGLGGVVPSLVAIEARLATHAAKLDSMSAALNQIVLKYVAAESDIMGIPLFMNPDFYEIIEFLKISSDYILFICVVPNQNRFFVFLFKPWWKLLSSAVSSRYLSTLQCIYLRIFIRKLNFSKIFQIT